MTELSEAQKRTATRARVVGAISVILFVAALGVGFLQLVVALYLFGFGGQVSWHKLARIESLMVATMLVNFVIIAVSVRIDPTPPETEDTSQ